ncbi:hypothetical protein LAZ29_05115 [Cereibacter sphaeroides]|uniref:hypothetical protein n=1 Tax=Cereibacter sphaeroides TaxID=1063 RepID=UPI001F408FAC|nr:hypothetical protein [Cereibacter sphaeroides]MCE6950297.1 hypothetical protein [Cereibacter sphaeroides]
MHVTSFEAAGSAAPGDKGLRKTGYFAAEEASFDLHDGAGRLLPASHRIDRKVANASTKHCTVFAVLGDGPGTRFQAESHLEYCHLLRLAADPAVLSLREQVLFRFGVQEEDKHFFDMVATMTSGARIAYTVKPEVELRSREFLSHMQHVARQVSERRFATEVRLLTEVDLDPIDLHNAKVFAALRDGDPEADAAARACISGLAGALPLFELTRLTGLEARGYRALLRLLRSGELRLARRERISPTSLVHKKDLFQ